MAPHPEPSAALLAGRRATEGLAGVELVEDISWDDHPKAWCLRYRLTPGVVENPFVPATTDWVLHVSSTYPWGEIHFSPAADSGLTATFEHQRFNGPPEEGETFRGGNICVPTGHQSLGRSAYGREPIGDAEERLAWQLRRGLEWLKDAARNDLVRPGEPFEVPDLPNRNSHRVVFCEGAKELAAWANVVDRAGLVTLRYTDARKHRSVATEFRTAADVVRVNGSFGSSFLASLSDAPKGAWVRLASALVLPPWQAPSTWGEFRRAVARQGENLDAMLSRVSRHFRDGKRHILLVGYPIPQLVGGTGRQMEWQALLLPVLSRGKLTAQGFRPNEMGYRQRDRWEVMKDEEPLLWLTSENWHPDQIATRGRLPETLRGMTTTIIGGGALGSALGEILFRAGVSRIIWVDHDSLHMGNLIRHTLDMTELEENKGAALVRRLQRLSPHAEVTAVAASVQDLEDGHEAFGSDLIVDCTGADEVLHRLGRLADGRERRFVSASFGFGARRTFCFAACGTHFPHERFQDDMSPWLLADIKDQADTPLPREGVGCWHPVFPARADDVWLAASLLTKDLEVWAASGFKDRGLVVYEHDFEDGMFVGVHRRTRPDASKG